MRSPTQAARILRLLEQRGERGITALDFMPPTADDGPMIMRLPSRVEELRRRGHHITSRLVRTPRGARVALYALQPEVAKVDPGGSAQSAPEPLALDLGDAVAHRPASPYDPEVA